MDDILGFMDYVRKLKHEKRAGWVYMGVEDSESVADHCFNVAVMALIFAKRMGLDAVKMVKMALLHDLPESIIGDRVTERGAKELMPYPEWVKKCEGAAKEIFQEFKEGEEFYKLWKEYETLASPEAKLLKQIEKLEMAMQTLEYEVDDPKRFDEFWENVDKYIEHPKLRQLLEKLKKKRIT